MHWQATLKDGTITRHIDGVSHFHLDPSTVTRFEVIEGNAVIWAMHGMPRNVRKRHVIRSNGLSGALYIFVMPHQVVFVFDTAHIVILSNFLPEKCDPGISEGGRINVFENGDVRIDGTLFPNGYRYFTPIDSHAFAHSHKHHKREEEHELRPDVLGSERAQDAANLQSNPIT